MTTAQAAKEQHHLIGGQWQPSAGGATFERINPYTGEAVTVAAAASREDARAAAEAAGAAFPAWAATGPEERTRLLNAAADLLEERARDIAATMTEECGATFGWGVFNATLAAGMLRHYAGLTGLVEEATEEIESAVPGLKALAVRQPAGVVLGMAPWNAPVILSTRAVAAPLAFGKHRDPQGVREVPARPRRRRGRPARRRPAAGRHQLRDAQHRRRARRRRGAHRPSRGAPGQLHRHGRRGQDHRAQVRRALHAGRARARRQGAVRRPVGR